MSDPRELLKGTTPGSWRLTGFGWIRDGKAEARITYPAESLNEAKKVAELIAAAPDLARRLAEAEALVGEARALFDSVERWTVRGRNPICDQWRIRAEALLAEMPKEGT